MDCSVVSSCFTKQLEQCSFSLLSFMLVSLSLSSLFPLSFSLSLSLSPLQEPNILDPDSIKLVAERAAQLMKEEPNVLTLRAPTVVSHSHSLTDH